MDISNLSNILQKEAKFRFKQAHKALFSDYISDWQDLSVFPLDLREKLSESCPLEIKSQIFQSENNKTTKALITFLDNLSVETVLIKQKDKRYTVCLSSQIGCPLACNFCVSGSIGFKRNLLKMEIIEQFLFWARYLKDKGEKIDNLVFMGMGEPLLNYDNILSAISMLNSKEAFNFGARRISISTAGLAKQIRKLAREPYQINLAISLHAPSDQIRAQLMSKAVKINSITEIERAVDYYIDKTNRQVMFEYVMIDKINDSPEMAKSLISLMRKPLYMLNLIPLNENKNYKASSLEKINKFASILSSAGVKVTIRESLGSDIVAACGQLAKIEE
jgi:23S rRNA (adenine2503-C2)-methyltransferase